jgi:RND family efflux transporter MFP subunit
VAEAQVDQEIAALKEAEIRLSYTKVAAAWEDGRETRVVGERHVDEGAMLTANSPLVSILDIHVLKAVIHCIERDYAKITIGQEALITTDAFPGSAFKGKVARIAPQLKETSRQARVEIDVPNDDGRLKPGMFVRVDLEFAAHKDVAVVPVAALARRGGVRGVFLADVQTGKARFVPLETGITSGDLVEVVSPPLDGPVVVMGQHLLEDGAAITVAEGADGGAEGQGGTDHPPANEGATSQGSRP